MHWLYYEHNNIASLNKDPKNQEDKQTKAQEIVNVVVMMCLGHLDDLSNGTREERMSRVKMVIHSFKHFILFIYLRLRIF